MENKVNIENDIKKLSTSFSNLKQYQLELQETFYNIEHFNYQ